MRRILLCSLAMLPLLSACGGGGGQEQAPTPPAASSGSSSGASGTASGTTSGSNSGTSGTTNGGTSGTTSGGASGGDNAGNGDSQATPSTQVADKVADDNQIGRFLNQATFGPTPAEMAAVRQQGLSAWLTGQFDKTASRHLPLIQAYADIGEHTAGMAFWKNAVSGNDQLRQRMAFALSQILVISDYNENLLFDVPGAVGYYQDLLVEHAFGNYRDLLEAITYSPAMGFYLTYMGSQKGDPATGRMPDENYARELLQLFTIGLVKLNPDGSVVTDTKGRPVETYDNHDITGLARVFTGLNLDESRDDERAAHRMPMQIFAEDHSTREKRFLGHSIPANTGARQSIREALDHIFAHDNVAPFVSRQLIQRFVTSHPTPAYVQRVARAFVTGRFKLPDGTLVGEGRRGDLKATISAVLLDPQARTAEAATSNQFGKLREPVLRFTAWARAFVTGDITPDYMSELWDTSSATALGQHPYRSPSVFNFFRPGYKAPGSETGKAGLTMPELQQVNATSIPGYVNFMSFFIQRGMAAPGYDEEYRTFVSEEKLQRDPTLVKRSFHADYRKELPLADNAAALVDHLDRLMTFGRLDTAARSRLVSAVESIPADDRGHRVEMAILMLMTTPAFLIQG